MTSYSLCSISDATCEILAETKITADPGLIAKFIENERICLVILKHRSRLAMIYMMERFLDRLANS